MLIDRSLRPNPFQTYRDCQTGRWVTVLPKASTEGFHSIPAKQAAPQPPELALHQFQPPDSQASS
jgi:hypothetical protein